MTQYKVLRDLFVIISSLQIISSVEAINFIRINVTRQSDGDILAFKKKVDCASLNAECFWNNKRESQRNMCDTCKCSSIYTTYVSAEKQCININGIAGLNCRTRQKQMSLLKKSTSEISRPIQAYRCKNKTRPEFHPNDGRRSSWSWKRMRDVNFSLKLTRFKNYSYRFWQVKFNKNSVSIMKTKYVGKIVKLEINCKMGKKTRYNTRMCMIFKIAGSFEIEHPYPTDSSNPTSTRAVTSWGIRITYNATSTVRHEYYTSARPDNNTVGTKNRKSGKGNQVTWVIVTVPGLVIVAILVSVLFFVCYKRRKRSQSNSEHPIRYIAPNEYDTPMIGSTHSEVHRNYENTEQRVHDSCSQHSKDNVYQELNPNGRERDSSQYQALIKQPQNVYEIPS